MVPDVAVVLYNTHWLASDDDQPIVVVVPLWMEDCVTVREVIPGADGAAGVAAAGAPPPPPPPPHEARPRSANSAAQKTAPQIFVPPALSPGMVVSLTIEVQSGLPRQQIRFNRS